MATTATALLIVTHPSDSNQASKEDAVCLAALTGDLPGAGVFDFIEDNLFLDTVA